MKVEGRRLHGCHLASWDDGLGFTGTWRRSKVLRLGLGRRELGTSRCLSRTG